MCSWTQLRGKVDQLAPTDYVKALAIARLIEDPWFACQSLATVARYAPDGRFVEFIDESFRVGRRAADPYNALGSSAWPVGAVVVRRRFDLLATILPELFDLAKQVSMLASRSEGLFLIFQAVFPAGERWWKPTFQELFAASFPLLHWRQARNLRDAVLIAASEDLAFARDAVANVPDEKLRARIDSRLLREGPRQPRGF